MFDNKQAIESDRITCLYPPSLHHDTLIHLDYFILLSKVWSAFITWDRAETNPKLSENKQLNNQEQNRNHPLSVWVFRHRRGRSSTCLQPDSVYGFSLVPYLNINKIIYNFFFEEKRPLKVLMLPLSVKTLQ